MNSPFFVQARKLRAMAMRSEGRRTSQVHYCRESTAASVVDIKDAQSLQQLARFNFNLARLCLLRLENWELWRWGLKVGVLHSWTTAEKALLHLLSKSRIQSHCNTYQEFTLNEFALVCSKQKAVSRGDEVWRSKYLTAKLLQRKHCCICCRHQGCNIFATLNQM